MKSIDKPPSSTTAAALPPDFPLTSYPVATAIAPTDTLNTYNADIKRDWCIGLVPHGGYLVSLVAKAVELHFQTKHKDLKQPDLITFHVEFLSRSIIGAASISITELKLGRQFSTVRVQLLQPDPKAGKEIPRLEALITQGNLTLEARSGGISLPTHPHLPKSSIPRREDCIPWPTSPERTALRPAAFKTQLLLPKGSDGLAAHPTLGPSIREQWVRWKPEVGEGKGFDISSLPYLADAFRPLPEAYGLVGNWFPTLSYNMEVKRKFSPPSQGWEWLFFRIEMHKCQNGRFDLDVLIADEEGEIVALNKHTALIVSAERNYKGRVEKL